MEHSQLGRTGLNVSKICLGTMTFGNQCDEKTSHAILDNAKDEGITFIDTAGLRKHKNKIEKIGIQKTKDIIEKSDLNLVFLEKNEKNKYKKVQNKLFVRSKSDKRKKTVSKASHHNISSITGEGIDLLLREVSKKTIKTGKITPVLSRERHISIMERVLKTLKSNLS